MFFFVEYGKQPYVSACNSVSHQSEYILMLSVDSLHLYI